MTLRLLIEQVMLVFSKSSDLHTVLFGFWPNLASHLGRSSLSHSYGYASTDDRPTCFASLTQNSDKIAWSDFEQPKAGPLGRKAGRLE